jgi:cation diffusion facilitator CzcD-associated flavoprotein CzcO
MWSVEHEGRVLFFNAVGPASERSPLWHWAYRAAIYWKQEAQVLGFTVEPRIMKLGQKIARKHLEASIQDPKLRAALTPNYKIGCKRILLSDDYDPALTRPNVDLVTDPIEAITKTGVLTRSGALREVDAIIYGTGSNVSEYIAPIHIQGAGGRDLNTRGRNSAIGPGFTWDYWLRTRRVELSDYVLR